jgi:oxaloacetate decarboxylase alpha subunit
VLDELTELRRECGWPPLASPIGQIFGSQAVLHVLSAQRWQIVVDELRDLIEGRFGSPPGEIDPVVRRAVQLIGEGATRNDEPMEIDEVRDAAEGLATSDEELLLLALFGDEAEPLLRSIRSRGGDAESLAGAGIEQAEGDRIRELIRIVQESGIGEVTIEEGETRVTVRRSDETAAMAGAAVGAPVAGGVTDEAAASIAPPADGTIRVESPMVGTFYRAPEPGAEPFVEEGDPVAPGQTLCILEAMKLMNEVKADVEAVVRKVCVENAQPVEYGQLLFELEPLNGRPLDAL